MLKIIIRNDTLVAIKKSNMLKSTYQKNIRSIKIIRNKLYSVKKDIDKFKVSSQICKKKTVNVITKQIHENNVKINTNNIKSIELNKKSTNSDNALELKRLKSEIEIYRNEIIRYTVRNERCMGDLKKLLDLSNAENNDGINIDNKPYDSINIADKSCDNINIADKSCDSINIDNKPCDNVNNESCDNINIDNVNNDNKSCDNISINDKSCDSANIDNERDDNVNIINEPSDNINIEHEPCDNVITDNEPGDNVNIDSESCDNININVNNDNINIDNESCDKEPLDKVNSNVIIDIKSGDKVNNDSKDDDSDSDSEDDDSDSKDNSEPGNKGNNDNKPSDNSNKSNELGDNGNKSNKPDNNHNKPNEPGDIGNKDRYDNKTSKKLNIIVALGEYFSNNIENICILINESNNDEIYDADPWLKYDQLNQINPLLDNLIDSIWRLIYNKKREKHEITNIPTDKDKNIDEYLYMNNDIIDDKLDFINNLIQIIDTAIRPKKINQFKGDILKSINNSMVGNIKKKDYNKKTLKKIIKKKTLKKIIKIIKKIIKN